MENKQCTSTNCTRNSCEGCPSKEKDFSKSSFKADANPNNKIKRIIGIVSGKGGVGKSFVTASLAVSLNKMGYKVGIMDADITGPSIPKMFGIKGKAKGCEAGIIPAVTDNGIKIMSVNLLLENEDDPVIWRGPVIAGVVKQFYTDVLWEELDVLFIDMPPGTGDVPLTVFQSLPVDGIVVVTSPQELVQLIVKKAYNMAAKMDIPIIGMIENYSYMLCPDCGKPISVFGKSRIDEVGAEIGIDVLAKLPIIPYNAELADKGLFEKTHNDEIKQAAKIIADRYFSI